MLALSPARATSERENGSRWVSLTLQSPKNRTAVDTAKLKKAVEKAQTNRDILHTRAVDAMNAYGQAERALGEARNEYEAAESLETARELRSKKSG